MNFCAYYQSQQSNQYHHQITSSASGHFWPLVTKVLDKRTTSPRFLSSSPSASSSSSKQQQSTINTDCNYTLQSGNQVNSNLIENSNSVVSGRFWSPGASITTGSIWSNRPESSFFDPIPQPGQVSNASITTPGRLTGHTGGRSNVGQQFQLQTSDSIEQLTVEEVSAILTSVSTGSTTSSSQSQSGIIVKREPRDEEQQQPPNTSSRMLLVQSTQPTCFGTNNNLADPNISLGQVTAGFNLHQQQSLYALSHFNNPSTAVTDAALNTDSAGGFEDLKLLDFPIYDPDEEDAEANFDEASLEDMFSPTSDDPQSPSSFVQGDLSGGPRNISTPITTCSASGFASSSPVPSMVSVGSRSHSEHMDIVMSSVTARNPINLEIPSPTGSGTPTLPSFLETYSPRYRSSLVSGCPSTSSTVSSDRHVAHQRLQHASAPRPPLVQQSSTDAFFKYEDLMADEESSLSPDHVVGTESLGHESPIGPESILSMTRSSSRTSSPFVSNVQTGLAFMKQEQYDTFDQLISKTPMDSHSTHQSQQPISPVEGLFSEQGGGIISPGIHPSGGLMTGSPSMGRPSSVVIKKEPSSRRSSKQSNQSYSSTGHRSSLLSGRSSVGSIGSLGSIDQGRAASFSPLSTHSTISPPLTPMTPPRTRGAIQRRTTTETLNKHKGTQSSSHRGASHSQVNRSGGQTQQKSVSISSSSTASSATSRSSASSSTHSTSTTHHESSFQQQSSQGSSGTTTRSVCAVCGDIAACQHYGVRTCEGCKGFFKRTVQKGAKYVCLGSKDCVVDKRRRNRCQFCRFQKCLSVGMVKEVVRTDDLKGRRGRLPSKPKSPQESPPSPPVSTITALVRAHLDTNPDLANLDVTQMNQVTHENVTEESVHSFYRIFHSSLDTIRAFGDKIPGFNELERFDQELLYQVSVLELFSLRFAFRNTFDSERMVFCNGTVLHRSQIELIFGSKWFNSIRRLSQHLVDMGLDISALACLCALSLINERHGLNNETKVEQLQMKIISSLRDHCTYNSEAQKKSWYFSKILSILSELRTLATEGLDRMQHLNRIISMPENLRKTLLDSTNTSNN